ncbi:unnamed protein product (macronuclear) [Paramecium tetraurelia]|uniref:t-SNARE coiled-coil homology domain-containing protein n=1 Tax=Paramecium tetraurelia TaxID=5888 RepID=A0DE05_PARTE|nr:uncharacterized protein GSPATT00016114001 [Paramecium tetraurelia]CAK81272.1 unnamed protein product [Paramecium tetraurelia]|eukprot:XP_001448669.1 hypothetical protein (macronuclear) [Paramecium tetraurelia strain d4-2]
MRPNTNSKAFNNGFRQNSSNSNVGLMIDQQNSLNYSHRLAEESLQIGEDVLESFKRQNDSLKNIKQSELYNRRFGTIIRNHQAYWIKRLIRQTHYHLFNHFIVCLYRNTLLRVQMKINVLQFFKQQLYLNNVHKEVNLLKINLNQISFYSLNSKKQINQLKSNKIIFNHHYKYRSFEKNIFIILYTI